MPQVAAIGSGTLIERRAALVEEFQKLSQKVTRDVSDGAGPARLVELSHELRDLTVAAVDLSREIDKNNTTRMNEGWGPNPVYSYPPAEVPPDSYGPAYRSFAGLRQKLEQRNLSKLWRYVVVLSLMPTFGAGVLGIKFLPVMMLLQILAIAPLMVHSRVLDLEASRWRKRALHAERNNV
jgi:hypothetical protein